MANRNRLLDAAILVMLGVIATRILGAAEPAQVMAGYVIAAATSAAIPVCLGALWLGFRKA